MKTTLYITGMNCQNCVHHVKEALSSVTGVEQATVDLSTGLATISGQANVFELIHTVKEQGYEAKVTE
ncbi:MAG: heavy-metal-associated domain-containing protein [Armatimonadetes bacterium]|nr:heavy-metal-associated domain-containing protein [Armatimonadota bacterium]